MKILKVIAIGWTVAISRTISPMFGFLVNLGCLIKDLHGSSSASPAPPNECQNIRPSVIVVTLRERDIGIL